MEKEIKEKIREFINELPQERRESWSNFGGGWYDFIAVRKDKFQDLLENLIEEILEEKS